MADRLDDAVNALRPHRLTVWRRAIYRDREGDGTGDIGWLWLRAEQRLFPEDEYDLLLFYSAMDGEWQASAPHGRTARIAETSSGRNAGQDALAAAAAVLEAAQTEGPGTVVQATSGLPGPEEIRGLPDWITLILGGVTASVIFPFVQAIAGKAADDAYTQLRTLLLRHHKSKPELDHPATGQPEPKRAIGYLRIADPDTGLQLIVPDPVPPEAIRELLTMDRSELNNRTLVWDTTRMDWFACRPG